MTVLHSLKNRYITQQFKAESDDGIRSSYFPHYLINRGVNRRRDDEHNFGD